MTSIIIAALAGFAGLLLGLAVARRGFAGWRAEILDHTASLKLANSVNIKLNATIARLSPLAEIGERVGNQARDERGRFKAKGK